ncbi:Sua5/YciO/YrdC/YwlC family protein [Streptomyces sp. NPDC050204]|uniref:L-threonylcarbamoyladenylate synthase n=1 Tax=Streptomyces sp. NPDC050204 TaxID=3155514 RepID=UPI0034482A50
MDHLTPHGLDTAAGLLGDGALVAVPTPRWYMILARAADPHAVTAVFDIKQRPEHKPLLLLVDSLATAEQHFRFSRDAHALAHRLWPGELALHLPWRTGSGRLPGIGAPALVSRPDGILGHLLSLVAEPVAAAACSISAAAATPDDHPALTAHQVAAFNTATGEHLAAVVDGGICPQGRHMTIVDCPDGEPARLHREGTVHSRAVTAALTEGVHRVG